MVGYKKHNEIIICLIITLPESGYLLRKTAKAASAKLSTPGVLIFSRRPVNLLAEELA